MNLLGRYTMCEGKLTTMYVGKPDALGARRWVLDRADADQFRTPAQIEEVLVAMVFRDEITGRWRYPLILASHQLLATLADLSRSAARLLRPRPTPPAESFAQLERRRLA